MLVIGGPPPSAGKYEATEYYTCGINFLFIQKHEDLRGNTNLIHEQYLKLKRNNKNMLRTGR
jgi:hypothetical protein